MIDFHAPRLPEPVPEDQPYVVAVLGDSEQPRWVKIVGHYPGVPALCGVPSGDEDYSVGRVENVDCPRCREQIAETFADWGMGLGAVANGVLQAASAAMARQHVRRFLTLEGVLDAAASWIPRELLRGMLGDDGPTPEGRCFDLAFVRSGESPLLHGQWCVLPPVAYLTPHGVAADVRLVVICEDNTRRVRRFLRGRPARTSA